VSSPAHAASGEKGSGTILEGRGVAPDVLEPFSPEAAWAGEDTQIARAIQVLAAA
jgi:C-terminal processing protease CtpA/Prc